MNDWVPLELYAPIFYYVTLIASVVVFAQSPTKPLDDIGNLKQKAVLGNILMVLIVLYIGTRPVSGKYFGDMRTYSESFDAYARGAEITDAKDYFFEVFMQTMARTSSQEMFFMVCCLLYVLPLYFASRKFFAEYWFYGFMMLVCSFSFWGSGTNGLRNGIATSIFLLGLSYGKSFMGIAIILASMLFHKSLLIPTTAFVISLLYTDTRKYLLIWLLCIPVSQILGSALEDFFFNLGFGEEDRLQGYLTAGEEDLNELFSKVGFRWDFLAYSATGVVAGWYFIVKRGFSDPLYIRIFNIYLIANATWILVIRATFSNRFAYLSWFMLGIVIIYPFLKAKFMERQHIRVAQFLLLYSLFTFILTMVLNSN